MPAQGQTDHTAELCLTVKGKSPVWVQFNYSHLAKMITPVGTDVKRGDIIGTVGSTGRSTGPHLDWRINWKNKRLDPLLLAGPLLPAMPIPRPF